MHVLDGKTAGAAENDLPQGALSEAQLACVMEALGHHLRNDQIRRSRDALLRDYLRDLVMAAARRGLDGLVRQIVAHEPKLMIGEHMLELLFSTAIGEQPAAGRRIILWLWDIHLLENASTFLEAATWSESQRTLVKWVLDARLLPELIEKIGWNLVGQMQLAVGREEGFFLTEHRSQGQLTDLAGCAAWAAFGSSTTTFWQLVAQAATATPRISGVGIRDPHFWGMTLLAKAEASGRETLVAEIARRRKDYEYVAAA